MTFPDGLIYLASPYSHPDAAVRQARFLAACWCAGAMMRRGLHVFSPIAHSHPIAECGGLPLGFDFWRTHDEHLLRACKSVAVLCIPGWDQSVGVRAELVMAKEKAIPIFHVNSDGMVLTGFGLPAKDGFDASTQTK